MTEDEYLESIRGRTYDYPIVLRTADPLLIRVNRTSLLVNNTNFFAKVKCGLAYNGYYIYSSGLGTQIAEVDLGKESITQQTMPDGTVVNKNQAWSDSTIAGKAEEFLNHLEARIYIMPSTNAIKEAIDRFCWQMHYDNTETPAELPEGFADIQIDKIDNNNFKTFKGYFLDMNANFVALNTQLGNDANLVNISITNVANNLRGTGEYTISKALRESGQSSVSGAVYQQTQLEQQHFTTISDTQLGDFGVNGNRTLCDTIGSACTVDWGADVRTLSTVLNVNNKLGAFGDTGEANDVTVYKTLGTPNDNSSDTTVFGKIAGVSGQVATVDGNVSTINTSIGSSGDTASETSTTLFGKLKYATKKETSLSYALLGGADYSSAPTDNVYTALLGGNNVGVIKKADGYVYADDHKDAFFYNGNTPTAVRKYYMDTEVSRFGLAYNFATQSKTTDVINAIKSQSASNPVPW